MYFQIKKYNTIHFRSVAFPTIGSDNNSEGKVDVLLSSLSPSPLPINKAILSHDDLVEPIKDLFGQIKWVFDRQIESQASLKRAKTEDK